MMKITDPALILSGFACFAVFSWGVKGHFRSTGAMPRGMMVLSALSLIGFLWYAARLITHTPAATWPAAMLLFAAALAMFFWAVRATAKTPPTLAFDDDRQSFLLHHGPYRHVRHPFYASYLLFWIGTALATPGLAAWLAPLIMAIAYTHAATREEQKFARSELASAYAAYRASAGMFLPRPFATAP
jgi:protein-S-isoprenylcysteine O-methyltransferase Ste14